MEFYTVINNKYIDFIPKEKEYNNAKIEVLNLAYNYLIDNNIKALQIIC